MPARVTLTATKGPLSGQEFVFAERTCCIVGRDVDCEPRLPREDRTVSRHHCLLDVNPPDIRIRDFGSMNGTYLNGRKIGQRASHMSVEAAGEMTFPEMDLSDGDEVAMGETVFGVAIHVPATCSVCGREISDSERSRAQNAAGAVVCTSCRSEVVEATLPPQNQAVVCSRCGKDVSDQVGSGRRGEFVCESCRRDPLEMVKLMLHSAMPDEDDALGITGYSVEKELGRGGMGVVYLGRKEDTGERVALKVMLPKVAVQPRAKEAFLRETENTRVLKHRNIIRLLDHGYSGGIFFMALEFCDGGSVDQLMEKRGGTLPVEEAVEITLQALDGLDYAHRALVPHVKRADGSMGSGIGITHRDIKPQNIFLSTKEGERLAKVGDYGLAKAFDNAGLSGHTRTGLVDAALRAGGKDNVTVMVMECV